MASNRTLYVLMFLSAVCMSSVAFKYENCPGPISVDTAPDSATVAVTWEHPYLSNVGKVGSISQTVSHEPGEQFPIGLTRVNYLAINSTDYRDLQVCTFVITVHDPVPPVFNTCPINVTARLGPDQTEMAVTWDIPQAVDNSKYVQLLSTRQPGSNFTAGTVTVTYTARDTTGNEAHCEFPVIVIPFITTTTGATTTTMAPTTAAEVTTKGEEKASGPGPSVITAKPMNWKLWTTRGLIWVSVLCLVCFGVITLLAFRRYHIIRRLKKSNQLAGDDNEVYPSSGGEEYDVWEDEPAGVALQGGSTGGGGKGEPGRRLNKAEELPLLITGGGH